MPEVHALLSASSSHRWLRCTPSPRLEEQCENKTSEYAEEGTRAHALAEKVLNQFLKTGKLPKRRPKEVEGEMWEAVGSYVSTCIEKINEARQASPDAVVCVEERLDFSRWVPKGFGTGDMVIVSDDYIEVVDLKYGKGVRVSAKENSQMRLYALGAFEKYGTLYGFDRVRMTIVQPRLDALSTDELRIGELLEWGGNVVRPAAEKAMAGEGEMVAGGHCRFCRYRMKCRALSEYMLEGVKADFAASELTEEEIGAICRRASEIKKWLSEVEAYALAQALEGRQWPGMKLVAGRSNRRITNMAKAAELLAKEYSEAEIWKPRELVTLTALEKLAGKKHLAELLGDLIEKPEGKPTLADESDKREAIATHNVKDDFDDNLITKEND